MSRTKFMGIFLIILGVISVVVGIVRGDMTSSAAMFIGYLVPALLGAMILIVDHIGGGESKTETGPSDAALAGQKNKKKKNEKKPLPGRASGFFTQTCSAGHSRPAERIGLG